MKRKPQSAEAALCRKTPVRERGSGSRITQEQIARHLGVTREYVNRVVTGFYENPAFKRRIAVAVKSLMGAGYVCPLRLAVHLFGKEGQ